MKLFSTSVDMTSGKIHRSLISFTIPIIVGNMFQQLYNMVDTAVVGRCIGSEALAAVGTSTPVIMLILGLMTGMSGGISVVIAQTYSRGDTEQTGKVIANGIWIMLAAVFLVTLSGLCFCPLLFRIIRVPDEIFRDTVLYASVLFIGAFATAAYNYEAGVLRAFGNSVVPLTFLIIASFLNVSMDLLFVQLFSMGVWGVAAATVLSQLFSAVLCFIYMWKKIPAVHLKRAAWKPNAGILRQQLKTGIPMSLSQSLLGISFLFAQTALNTLGTVSVAAYTAASKMDTLAYQVIGAFGTSISTFSAQNYGKNNFDRIHKGVRDAMFITIGISLFLTAFVFLFGRPFMLLFIGANETDILNAGLQYMHITSLCYLFLCGDFVFQHSLVGIGKSFISTMVCFSEILTRVAVTYLFVYRIGFMGICFVSPACWLTSTILCIICYRPMMRSAMKRMRADTADAESEAAL